MAIPDKPLVIDATEITLGDYMWIESIGEGEFTAAQAAGLARWIINCSNWTLQDVRPIKLKEMEQVAELLKAQMAAEEEEAVPPPSDDASETGQKASDEPSQPGLHISPSPSDGESHPGNSSS